MAPHFAIKTDYPFLAHPPPQKKFPLHPLPSTPPCPSPESASAQATRRPRRRSCTFSAISSWAAQVQPGSPAALSPRSPHRRPSLTKGRRSSVTSTRTLSSPFPQIAPTPESAFTPTPSVCDFKVDLTTVGYTSVFLQLPNTPISATLSLSIKTPSPCTTNTAPAPLAPSSTCKSCAFTCFRSLSVIRSQGRSKPACPDPPARMRVKAAAASAAIFKRTKGKYAMRPPALANELALMQFTDGGNLDDNTKRIMKAQVKATGTVSLADVYRDGEGGIRSDHDEEWEYAHLLGEGDESRPRTTGGPQWVAFGSTSPSSVGMLAEERRGSVSTQDSHLDPKCAVQPVDWLERNDLALFSSAIVPKRKPAAPVLSVPSRTRRAAPHLQKSNFLVDVAFPLPHTSPKNPRFPASSDVNTGMKPKGKTRRRPAPLKLSPPGPACKQLTNSPVDVDKVWKDFITASC